MSKSWYSDFRSGVLGMIAGVTFATLLTPAPGEIDRINEVKQFNLTEQEEDIFCSDGTLCDWKSLDCTPEKAGNSKGETTPILICKIVTTEKKKMSVIVVEENLVPVLTVLYQKDVSGKLLGFSCEQISTPSSSVDHVSRCWANTTEKITSISEIPEGKIVRVYKEVSK